MNIIGWWKLDKLNAAGLVPDCSGNGFDGTLVGDLAFVRNAASFNGTNARITLPNGIHGYLTGKPGITMSARIKLDTLGVARVVASFLISSGLSKAFIAINANNKIYAGGRSRSAESFQAVTCVDSFTDTTNWHHWLVSVDLAADSVVVYLDGVLQATTGTINFGQGTYDDVWYTGPSIGSQQSSYLWNGLIGDMRIYDGPSSIEKIKAIVADRKGRPYPWQPKIVEPTVEEVVCYG